MKTAIAQLAIERGNPSYNLDLIRRMAEDASDREADLLCLPEMVTTGFDWKKNNRLLDESKQHHEEVSRIARHHEIAICGSFLERASSGMPCNTLIYFDGKGEVLARYRKIHLFTLFHEEQHVQAGNEVVVTDTEFGKAGFGICYDLRFPELFRKNTEFGAQIQILPAAFPYPRLEHWRTLIRARAIENQCFFVAFNQCGVERHASSVGSTHYFGHSIIVDPWGEVLLEMGEGEGLEVLDIDLNLVQQIRAKMTVLEDRRPELFSP